MQRAADAILASARPVIVAGGGVVTAGAWHALTTLAVALNIPVGTSINGKGSIAENSSVSLGIVGGNGARSYANAWVTDADLVIYVGSRTDSTTTHHWTVPSPTGPQRVIQLDVEPWEIGNNYRLVAPLAGDARLGLEDILDAIEPSDRTRFRASQQTRIDALLAERDRYWAEIAEQAKSDSQPIKPQRLVRAMREQIEDDAIIVADPGTPTPYLGAQYELRRAGRTTVIPRAHGGPWVRDSRGRRRGNGGSGRRVVGMTGDGSFGMSCGEMETITRLNLPVVIIQCSNGSYGWIKQLQHIHHDDRYFGVDFNTVDYAAIARGFGFRARQVVDPADIDGALAEALADGGPYFLDVVTEAQMTETPPVAGWESAEAARRLALGAQTMTTPIILDVDTGVDDAVAIALALADPEIELVACTTLAGNIDVINATNNTLNVLDFLGAPEVPVYQGASRPLVRPLFMADYFHGSDGLGESNLPKSTRGPGRVSWTGRDDPLLDRTTRRIDACLRRSAHESGDRAQRLSAPARDGRGRRSHGRRLPRCRATPGRGQSSTSSVTLNRPGRSLRSPRCSNVSSRSVWTCHFRWPSLGPAMTQRVATREGLQSCFGRSAAAPLRNATSLSSTCTTRLRSRWLPLPISFGPSGPRWLLTPTRRTEGKHGLSDLAPLRSPAASTEWHSWAVSTTFLTCRTAESMDVFAA